MLQLQDWNGEFAARCTYQYLNAGPGRVASLLFDDTALTGIS